MARTRRSRTRSSVPTKAHFAYHSEQVHSLIKNGRGATRRNVVSIRNGRGEKAVEVYDAKGRQQSRVAKRLRASEVDRIRKNQFIPGLFKDCC
jgi:hypothetical protein